MKYIIVILVVLVYFSSEILDVLKLSQMSSDCRRQAIVFYCIAHVKQIPVHIKEANRSYSRQFALFEQGRFTDGAIVTNALPSESKHTIGQAFDVDLTNLDRNQFDELVDIAVKLNFTNGSRFKSLIDSCHFELITKN